MVKGISRRVIVIKSPDPKYFDEAIFIVKEDILHRGVTSEEVIKEAREVANAYTHSGSGGKKFRRIPPPAYALLGAFAASLLWFAEHFLF